MTPAEHLRENQAKRKAKRAEANQKYNQNKKEQHQPKQKSDSKWAIYKRKQRLSNQSNENNVSKWAMYKQAERKKTVDKKERDSTRKRIYRERKRKHQVEETARAGGKYDFPNRMSRSRTMKRMQLALPATPLKQATIIREYISKPSMQTIKKDIIDTESVEADAVHNVKEFISKTKMRRSDEARQSMAIITASVSGENISKHKSKLKLASQLGICPRRLSGGRRIRDKIFGSEDSCYRYIARKKRNDAISDTNQKVIYNFWKSSGISRISPNKKDIKRERIAPKEYAVHTIHLLETTQTEAFLEFKQQHPEINIRQRTFENLKPFYVIAARPKDRDTCCCRMHTETRMVFKRCMEYRRNVLKNTNNMTMTDEMEYPIYEHLNDVCNATLCPKENGKKYHTITCLNRECDKCGVSKIKLLECESNDTSEVKLKWEKYEYIEIKAKGDTTKRKIQLVKQTTTPGPLFKYLFDLMETFPAHQFRATWQNQQYKSITENLPLNHAVIVHDFSENYRCSDKQELQSSYFQKTEVSIHVSIMHRHSILEYDGKESLPSEPNIITEQFFLISDDLQHDRYFTVLAQREISEYLQNINANVKVMHEFTDGCSCQYKSRNCMGDVSCSCADLHYDMLIRNFYETSHAKGPQDAAGGFLKRQADMAVLRSQATIQHAKDLFTFSMDKLQDPKSGIYSRRVFRYVKEIPRLPVRDDYSPVLQNRKIHQIAAFSDMPSTLVIKHLSCYQCDSCLAGNVRQCDNKVSLGHTTTVKMEARKEKSCPPDVCTDAETDTLDIGNLITKDALVAVMTDDPTYEYYLLKVTKEPVVLNTALTDSWGAAFPSGATVVHGDYYEKCGDSLFKHKLLKNRKAIVYSVAVRFICAGEPAKSTISLSQTMHEDIVEAMNF